MTRIVPTLALAAALTAGSVTVASQAEANPMILGIAAGKFIAIAVVSGIVGAVIAGSAVHHHNWNGDWNNGCPVHIAHDGHRYTRSNCT